MIWPWAATDQLGCGREHRRLLGRCLPEDGW